MTEDWIEQELRFKRREQDEERRWRRYRKEQWTTRLGYFATALGLALAVAVIGGFFFVSSQKHAEREHQERIACNEAGGTFITYGTNQLCLVGVEQR